uniref:Uncharacterized protein n=1 Tax=Knipowitschia caucasica TaxID=637954 RepID=A0AAV2MG65_KNICA
MTTVSVVLRLLQGAGLRIASRPFIGQQPRTLTQEHVWKGRTILPSLTVPAAEALYEGNNLEDFGQCAEQLLYSAEERGGGGGSVPPFDKSTRQSTP